MEGGDEIERLVVRTADGKEVVVVAETIRTVGRFAMRSEGGRPSMRCQLGKEGLILAQQVRYRGVMEFEVEDDEEDASEDEEGGANDRADRLRL
jgi:hypothetical protein